MKLFNLILHALSLLAVGGLAFYSGFLFNETSQAFQATAEKEAAQQLVSTPPIEVAVAPLATQAYVERLTYTGTITPWKQANLAFHDSGIIQSIAVEKGDLVHGPTKGQPGQALATLDQERIQAQVKATKADLEKARWDRKQAQVLHTSGKISEEEVRRLSLLCELKAAELTITEKAVKDATLRAPFSGVIATRFIELGEPASPVTPAYRLIAMDRVKVVVNIPGRRIGEIRRGQAATVSVETKTGEKQTLTGKVHNVPPAAQNHLFPVEVVVTNKDNILREGMIARVRIFTQTLPRVFLLPLETVIQAGTQRKVMVMEQNKRVYTGTFDPALLPATAQPKLEKLKLDMGAGAINEIEIGQWKNLEFAAKDQVAAKTKSTTITTGPVIRVYHVGNLAREIVLTTSRIEDDWCLLPNDGTLTAGEMLIIRGQHRVAPGGEVVIAQRNELPAPGKKESR